MKTPNSKPVGLLLITAALALFGWLAYEPAQIVSTLELGELASEAAVVVATLSFVAVGLTGGAVLLLRTSSKR
jgi:hypothetical protein